MIATRPWTCRPRRSTWSGRPGERGDAQGVAAGRAAVRGRRAGRSLRPCERPTRPIASVMVVMSVDEVNALTGETAGYGQRGYIFGPHEVYNELDGWRKSLDEIADFHLRLVAELLRSGPPGRPENVGVIGRRRLRRGAPRSRSSSPRAAAQLHRGDRGRRRAWPCARRPSRHDRRQRHRRRSRPRSRSRGSPALHRQKRGDPANWWSPGRSGPRVTSPSWWR